MPKSFSLIPSPVPLDVLGALVGPLIDRLPDERYASGKKRVKTRLAGVCKNNGIDTVWMLALIGREKFLKLTNAGKATAGLAEKLLADADCTFDMFPRLRVELENVASDVCRASQRLDWLTLRESLMALAGIGDWAKEPAIIAALAEHGLRPGMPLEELFVYDPSLAVSSVAPPQTITERVATFAQKTVGEAMPDFGIASGLDPTMTVADFMLGLAAGDDNSSAEFFVRRRLLRRAVHRAFNTETCDVLGIRSE